MKRTCAISFAVLAVLFEPTIVDSADPVLRLLESPEVVRYDAGGDLGAEEADQYCWWSCNFPSEITEIRLDGMGERLLFLSANVGDYRSLFLRSVDGGRHWSEPLRLQQGTAVDQVYTLDAKTAWILLGWTIESTGGDDALLLTEDAGATWRRLGIVHKPFAYLAWAESLVFSDISHGRCVVRYDDPVDGDTREAVFATTDGGRTWQEESRAGAQSLSLALKQSRTEEEEFSARDGTRWRVVKAMQAAHRGGIQVERRRSSTDPWEVRSVIPAQLNYDHGRLSSTDESRPPDPK